VCHHQLRSFENTTKTIPQNGHGLKLNSSFFIQFNQSFDLPQQMPSGFARRHPVGYRYPETAVKVVRQP
jgi:hypothetical protein